MHRNLAARTSSVSSCLPDESRWGYVLPIEERYWTRFSKRNRAGKKVHAYVLAGNLLSARVKLVFFYSIHPIKEVLGYADFLERISGDSRELWKSNGHEACLNSFDEYSDLTRRKDRVTFFRFTNLQETSKIVSFDQVSGILATTRMSQTGMYLTKEQSESLLKLLMGPDDANGILCRGLESPFQ